MLENKMSKFDVRINMLDKKFDFIIEKLAPEALPINLQRCEDKLVIQDNVDNDEKLKNNVNLLKHETIIGKVTQHFSNPCADMEYEKIGSDSENYYDIPDEFEKQHVINLESLKNNVHDSVSNNHEKLSVSKGRDVLNLTIEEDVLSSSSSVIDESEKTRVKIKPVENFHFKPVDNNINGNYIMDTIITEKNFQHNEYNNNCEKKAIGVNEEYRKPVEMHKNSHSNILWESDTPCLLFCHSSENNKFNLMGDTKCKIISSVSNDYYTLVFSGLIPDNLLLAVKLDENIDFKIMGENHVMFKFIHFDEKCEEVKNHCIEFKSREYVDEFIKVICNLCG
ncbi:Hypothetical protein SRAE_2000100500 [Strongyloides ratti]|uniref:Uncharacterized protein n=1 Tax=Strongyloides ratti TaxID=34506 RepID=A0A090LFR9_STRRB|nr:Hypothetical protein SRAE_2000100500 [Strongyloides ratti]CEF66335.1 Hypothetical protein SRAE_2000100500 [Strongyloides ratti]